MCVTMVVLLVILVTAGARGAVRLRDAAKLSFNRACDLRALYEGYNPKFAAEASKNVISWVLLQFLG